MDAALSALGFNGEPDTMILGTTLEGTSADGFLPPRGELIASGIFPTERAADFYGPLFLEREGNCIFCS